MMHRPLAVAACFAIAFLANPFALPRPALASDLDEFKIKREPVFEFAAKPRATIDGDRVTIEFETTAFCDVTVAIEDAEGNILRHLASGVLGGNAPAPFAKNSKKQTLIWDGKDDAGRYVDRKDECRIRVALGLKAQFERTLFWSPKKRLHQGAGRWGFVGTTGGLPTPRIAAAPEGVYVYEGRGLDHVRLFDHAGEYVRTVYPPPADKLDAIVGLEWFDFPQGERLPLKHDVLQTTFLTSGPSGRVEKVGSMFGTAATALAARSLGDGPGQTRLALVHRSLNRLAGDGSSVGLPLAGPATSFKVSLRLDGIDQREWHVSPTSAAFSPDGKTLYCTGYMWRQGRHTIRISKGCLHGVIRIDYESDEPPTVFAGSLKQHDSGIADGRFRDATSVDCDPQGRVYVTDYANDRIQVFSPGGTHLRNIPAHKPALLRIHRRTGELYVFSWSCDHGETLGREVDAGKDVRIPPTLTVLGPFDDPVPRRKYPLPIFQRGDAYSAHRTWAGLEFTAELDSWTDPPTIWLVPGVPDERTRWEEAGIRLLVEREGGLEQIRDFAREAAEAVVRLVPPMWSRQRLYANPKTGLLYVAEGQTTHHKAFFELIEIDPARGRIKLIDLPFDAEDMAFDAEGLVYLKTHDLLVRYDLATWREIPFDYGEQHQSVGTSSSRDGRRAEVMSALPLYNGTGWHKGGVHINVRGDILTSSFVTKGDAIPFLELRTDEQQVGDAPRSPYYTPKMYPGRLRFGELHIWDRHGRRLHEDVVPGLVEMYGVGLDSERNVYVMAAPTRVLDGERYFNRLTGTLMKFAPNRGRIVSENSHLIPVPLTRTPERPPDLIKGGTPAWVEGAEWFYGGVGYSGKNEVRVGGHCSCWNSRFCLDYFARSFAPEIRRFRVAVLDSSGNLILRVGQYGNVDDGRPVDDAPHGRTLPPGYQPRSIGGDEVALMHGAYVATLTDRRLFIADPGNARILSVRLDYHTTESVSINDAAAKGGDRARPVQEASP